MRCGGQSPIPSPVTTRWLPCLHAVALALIGCSAPPLDADRSQAIVYGPDDRVEAYEVGSPLARALVTASMVALVRRSNLDAQRHLSSAIPTWQRAAGLCPGEPFGDQPAAAFCSGVLVDDDLVLTAGHCLRLLPLSEIAVVFGYFYEAAGQLAMRPADVVEPVAIVAERLDDEGAPRRADFGWIRLARPAPRPRSPAPLSLRESALAVGAPLTVISTGGGVPFKADEGARVAQADAAARGFFVAGSDTSAGSSGGGAFDAHGALIGILARGGIDFATTPAGCATTMRVPAAEAAEEYTHTAEAVAGLCTAGPETSTLCRADCGEPCRALPRPEDTSTDASDLGGCAVARGPAIGRDRALPWALFVILLLAARPKRP
jgi:hypothetical protein